MGKKIGEGLILIFLLILASGGFAEERPQNVISFDLIELAGGAFNFGYEKVLSPKVSFDVNLALGSSEETVPVRGAIGVRHYLFESKAPEGFWAGICAYFAAPPEESLEYVSVKTVGGGLNVGYKAFLPDNFNLEGFLGYYLLIEKEELLPAVSVRGITVSFRIGRAF